MRPSQSDIDRVVSETIRFVERQAIEDYENGRIQSLGWIVKRNFVSVLVGIAHTYDEVRLEESGTSRRRSATLHMDNVTHSRSTVLWALKKACDRRGIALNETYSDNAIPEPRLVFEVPLGSVSRLKQELEETEKAHEETRAHTEEELASGSDDPFMDALRGRRHGVVEKVAEAIKNYESTALFSSGLVECGDCGTAGDPIVTFSELGLVDIEDRQKLVTLANAVLEVLNADGDEYSYHVCEGELSDFHVTFSREAKEPSKPLSEW